MAGRCFGAMNLCTEANARSRRLLLRALQVVEKLRAMRLAKAAEIVETGIDETLSYYSMPPEHWRCLRTNNPLERVHGGAKIDHEAARERGFVAE